MSNDPDNSSDVVDDAAQPSANDMNGGGVDDSVEIQPETPWNDSVRDSETEKGVLLENCSYEQGHNDDGALGTCGPTTIANCLNRITETKNYSENGVLHSALDNNMCHKSENPYSRGGTTTKDVVNIIDNIKDPESNTHTEVYDYNNALDINSLADRLDETGTVAMVGVDSATLWDQRGDVSNSGLFQGASEAPSDHWIMVDSPVRDENGNVTGFNIVDSGGGVSFVDRDKFERMYQGDENHKVSDPTAILVSNKGEAVNTYSQSEGIERTSNYKGEGSAFKSDGSSSSEGTVVLDIEEAKQCLFEEAIGSKSQEVIDSMPSWKDELAQKDVSISSINDIMSRPMSERSDEEIKQLFEMRTKVDSPNEDTLMSKVIPAKDAKNYLENGESSNEVRGCVARGCDCSGLKGADDYIKTFGLNYIDDNTGKAPYIGVDHIQVIRFQSGESNQTYIPFGGNSPEDVEKFKTATNFNSDSQQLKPWSMPFDGGGFTQEGTLEPGVTNHCPGSPEFRVDKPIAIEEGAAIFDIPKDGPELLLGVYDGSTWIPTKEGEEWLKNQEGE